MKNPLYQWKRKKIKHIDFFECEEFFLIITKEGLWAAMESLAIFLSLMEDHIHFVINLGVAGSLRNDLTHGQIILGKDHYCSYLEKHEFHSYPSFQLISSCNYKRVDIVSVPYKILQVKKKKLLQPIASVVDRESYPIAKLAKRFKKDFLSLKIISDKADEQTSCEWIIDQAQMYSEQLYHALMQLPIQQQEKKKSEESEIDVEGIFLTQSQKNQLSKIIQAIIRAKLDPSKIIHDEYAQLEKENPNVKIHRPKELTKILLTVLSKKYENIQYLG